MHLLFVQIVIIMHIVVCSKPAIAIASYTTQCQMAATTPVGWRYYSSYIHAMYTTITYRNVCVVSMHHMAYGVAHVRSTRDSKKVAKIYI